MGVFFPVSSPHLPSAKVFLDDATRSQRSAASHFSHQQSRNQWTLLHLLEPASWNGNLLTQTVSWTLHWLNQNNNTKPIPPSDDKQLVVVVNALCRMVENDVRTLLVSVQSGWSKKSLFRSFLFSCTFGILLHIYVVKVFLICFFSK